ncbi:serine threonine- kinase fray2 [Olea europaea subsp. europaea]|nr:serine threonine- kinase fray2 [Olea europaea subsp. europaea]
MDSTGEVKLADFGVSASMFDKGDRQRSRNTFVGTPCWMAPEVLQPGTGYNFKADIWSFGITALELAHGHAPFSKYPPMKVLLMTIQNAPPGLDYDRDKRFSKSFKELVAMCLVKDQTKRPTAEKLLKHSFFKNAKPPELSVKKLFADLPPLWKRVKDLQLKDAAQLALERMPSAEREAISQSEYQRGVSAWNFDVEDLKLQASLLQEEDDMQEIKEEDGSNLYMNHKVVSSSGPEVDKPGTSTNNTYREKINGDEVPVVDSLSMKEKVVENDILDSDNQGKTGINESVAKTRIHMAKPRQTQSGPLMPGVVLSNSKSERTRNLERCEIENHQVVERAQQVRKAPSFSGPLMLPNRASANSLSAPIKSSGGFKDSIDDKSRTNLVQIKGRFSVTSENVDLVKDIPLCTSSRRNSQGSPLRKSASVGDWMFDSKPMPNNQPAKEISNSNVSASILMPHLQNLFQQTSIQQDLIMNLLNSLQLVEVADAPQNGKLPPLPRGSENNGSVDTAISERERMLLMKITELQSRMISLTDELNAERIKYMQLQQQLNAVSGRVEDGDRREGDS